MAAMYNEAQSLSACSVSREGGRQVSYFYRQPLPKYGSLNSLLFIRVPFPPSLWASPLLSLPVGQLAVSTGVSSLPAKEPRWSLCTLAGPRAQP
jgi:hypothetical protein